MDYNSVEHFGEVPPVHFQRHQAECRVGPDEWPRSRCNATHKRWAQWTTKIALLPVSGLHLLSADPGEPRGVHARTPLRDLPPEGWMWSPEMHVCRRKEPLWRRQTCTGIKGLVAKLHARPEPMEPGDSGEPGGKRQVSSQTCRFNTHTTMLHPRSAMLRPPKPGSGVVKGAQSGWMWGRTET